MNGEEPPQKPDRLLERLPDLELEADRVAKGAPEPQKLQPAFAGRLFVGMLAAILLGPFAPMLLVRVGLAYGGALVGLLVWGIWLFVASLKFALSIGQDKRNPDGPWLSGAGILVIIGAFSVSLGIGSAICGVSIR